MMFTALGAQEPSPAAPGKDTAAHAEVTYAGSKLDLTQKSSRSCMH